MSISQPSAHADKRRNAQALFLLRCWPSPSLARGAQVRRKRLYPQFFFRLY